MIRNLATDQSVQAVVEETIATINAQQWEECRKCHKLHHFMSQCKTGTKNPRKARVDEIEKSGKKKRDGR